MPGQFLFSAVLAVVGMVFVLTGYQTRYKRHQNLIAGFDRAKVVDPDALGRSVGQVGILLGSACLVAAALAWVFPEWRVALGIVVALAALCATIAASVTCSRHLQR